MLLRTVARGAAQLLDIREVLRTSREQLARDQ
jgi:hypothetical protein